MQCIIKKYENKDEKHVKELIHLCLEDTYLIKVLNSSRLIFAYSAFCDNKLVSLLLAWTSSFHPHCTYIRILSNPIYRSANIEEELLSKVEEQEGLKFPLQTSIWETSANIKNIYEDNGFKEIRRTYMPTLYVSHVNQDISIDSERYILKTLTAVSRDEGLLRKLTSLVKSNYENTHLVNPVVDASIDKWKELIFADDIIPDGSYIFLDLFQSEIVAYSFLHQSEKNDTYELGWCGVAGCYNKELVSHLTFHQIKYATEHDVQFIEGEFDSTDHIAMEVLKSFPFKPSPTLITYQKAK